MGLSTVHTPMTFSKLPKPFPLSSHSPLLLLKPSLPLTQTLAPPSAALSSRSISLRNVLRRASTSEETSSGTNSFFDEKRDGSVVVDGVKPEIKSSFNEIEDNEEVPAEEQGPSFDFLDNLNLKFDADDTGSLVVYGGGAIVVLWLTSALIGAIDSIPLLPKLLEVVGLGYTIWFTSRYLLFKRNRDELFAKIEDLKEQVLGSDN